MLVLILKSAHAQALPQSRTSVRAAYFGGTKPIVIRQNEAKRTYAYSVQAEGQPEVVRNHCPCDFPVSGLLFTGALQLQRVAHNRAVEPQITSSVLSSVSP